MKIEWLNEASREFRDLVTYYRYEVGIEYARHFSDKIINTVAQLETFPEMGVLRRDTLLGKYGFRALFIGKYVCIYKIEGDSVLIYHLTDARKNYIYHIFGIE